MKILFIALILSSSAFAYIPPLKMILERTSENAGAGVYALETTLFFTDSTSEATLKESWLVENERTMKLIVTGLKELKGLRLTYLYQNGLKWAMKGNKRESQPIPNDFLERWHHVRNADALSNFLVSSHLIPEFKKDNKSRSIFEESILKLSRSQGVVNYSIGEVNKEALNPKIWIEQDFFVIRKIRLPSQVELEFDNYKTYSKGLAYPKQKLIRWGLNKVTVNTLSIVPKAGNLATQFSPSSLSSVNQSEALYGHPLKSVIEDFYTRFR